MVVVVKAVVAGEDVQPAITRVAKTRDKIITILKTVRVPGKIFT